MDNNLIDVSVIVPAYNVERYIGRCLRSLIAQTFDERGLEILVINDASTDNTEYALELFKNPKGSSIRVLKNEENKGLPYSLNRGINSARGEMIVRVDADDFVNKNYVTFLHAYLSMNPGCRAVACDYLLVDNCEDVLRRCDCMEEPIGCGIMFYREDLVRIGGFDEAFRCNEEKELRLRFEKEHRIERLKLPLYRYRRHGGNMTCDANIIRDHDKLLADKHGSASTCKVLQEEGEMN